MHDNYSDERYRDICIYCDACLQEVKRTKDHVPSKALLEPPYPENLPVVDVCQQCNAGFSKDEQYFSAFLAAVISGSTNPDPDRFPTAAKTLTYSAPLRERIERSRQVQATVWGDPEVQGTPEIERIARVIVKNARGHSLFELGLPLLSDPAYVGFSPILVMSDEQKAHFGSEPESMLWPEVGSRMMQRMVIGDLQPGGWVEVQPGTYRYAVYQLGNQRDCKRVLPTSVALCKIGFPCPVNFAHFLGPVGGGSGQGRGCHVLWSSGRNSFTRASSYHRVSGGQ